MSMTTEQPPPATPPGADLTQTLAAATGAGGPTALRPWQKTLLFSTPVLLVGLGWGAPVVVFRKYAPPAAAPEAERAAAEADGARLFAQHCAQCHGERGDGNGVASLWPRARNFGEGKFRLATTANGVPTDDDLLFVLRHGIPGSAMPAFTQFAESELHALVGHVRRLIRGGVYDRLRRLAEQEGDVDLADLNATVEKLTRPGRPLELPRQFAAATPESLARGRQVYLKGCASCHGPEGRGDGAQVNDLKNMDGSPNRPRDLTLGRFKGGGEPERVYARIMLGMPGSPMPAISNVSSQEVSDLLNYILSLSPPAAEPRAATSASGVSLATSPGP